MMSIIGRFLLAFLLCISSCYGFFNFFHQEQQRQPEISYEDQILNSDCLEYICPNTKQCVKKPIDCDCPFPSSQLKCVLPDKKNYVCISKPALLEGNEELAKIYDDPAKGPLAKNKGVRDCGWVIDAWNDEI